MFLLCQHFCDNSGWRDQEWTSQKKNFRPCCHKDRLYPFVVFWIIRLSTDTDEAVLKDAFGWHGEIIEGNVVDYLGCNLLSGLDDLRFTWG